MADLLEIGFETSLRSQSRPITRIPVHWPEHGSGRIVDQRDDERDSDCNSSFFFNHHHPVALTTRLTSRNSCRRSPYGLDAILTNLFFRATAFRRLLSLGQCDVIRLGSMDLDSAEGASSRSIDCENRKLLDFAFVIVIPSSPGSDQSRPRHAAPHDPLHLVAEGVPGATLPCRHRGLMDRTRGRDCQRDDIAFLPKLHGVASRPRTGPTADVLVGLILAFRAVGGRDDGVRKRAAADH